MRVANAPLLDAEVSVVLAEPGVDAGDVLPPATRRARAAPSGPGCPARGDRHGDRAEVEAPRRDEGEVVVEPARRRLRGRPRPSRRSARPRPPSSAATSGGLSSVASARDDLGGVRVEQPWAISSSSGPSALAPRAPPPNSSMLSSPMPARPVEALGVVGRDAGERRGGRARGRRAAPRRRARAARRPSSPVTRKRSSAEGVGDRRDVGRRQSATARPAARSSRRSPGGRSAIRRMPRAAASATQRL